jgi:hypothetical protein
MADQIFPLIDPKHTGMVNRETFIDLIYSHESARTADAMLATKALGSKARPKGTAIDPGRAKISKASAHKANVVWAAQQVNIDSLELTKIYGRDVWESKAEHELVVYLMNHYTYGLTFLFDWYCAMKHKSEAKTNKLLFTDRDAHDQITFRKALKMVKDFRLSAPRAKIEHHEKSRKNPKIYRRLPEGTFCQFAWIDSMGEGINIGSDSKTQGEHIPRLTRTGLLPVSPIEVKERFNIRTRHVMQWRKMDIASGLTSIASIALFLMDIAVIACSRMEVTRELFEREHQSGDAVKAYFDAVGGAEAMTGAGGSSGLAERAGKEAQKRCAERRCAEMIRRLSPQQMAEALFNHINLSSTDHKVLQRQILMTADTAFKYPVGTGIAKISAGKAGLRKGTYIPKKVFNQNILYRVDPELKGKDIVEFLKRSIINLGVESGKSYRTIFNTFDNNKNGMLEPNEVWEWFTRLAPDGMLSTDDFRTKILSQLYGLRPNEPYTPECVSRLHLSYKEFEKWVTSANVSLETY